MKPSQLITICQLLHTLIQIKGQVRISTCGRNLSPFPEKGLSSNHHWPWHAAIYHQNGTFGPEYKCGGTVISTSSVLTAAHCVSVNNAELDVDVVTVSLGRLNLAKNENSAQSFNVSEILVHPDYNSIDYVNDIAIVRLSAHAIFNNYVQPICLWKPDRTDILEVVGKAGIVIGWGITENGAMPSVLQHAHFPVMDFYDCVKSNPYFFSTILTKKSFCAGDRNGTSLCQGDSGGSIIFEEDGIYYIRGLVSVGQLIRNSISQELECDSTQYAIFTDVAKFLPWIIEKTTMERELTAPLPGSSLPLVNLGFDDDDVETDFSICGQLSPRQIPLMSNSYDARHWPWHAGIYTTHSSAYLCGGTLISSKAILTAAHCVELPANKLFVSMGRLNVGASENGVQTFRADEVIVHPAYKHESNSNDIAIIKLSTDAIFNRYVRPVCLWKSSNTDLSEIVGKLGTIVGWERKETGDVSAVLQEATAPVVNCNQSNVDIFPKLLTETNLCAGHLNGTGVCFRDTAGSLTLEQNGIYYLRGIASAAISDFEREIGEDAHTCDPTGYAIFTDIAKFLPWIIEMTTVKRAPAAPISRRRPIAVNATDFSICGQLPPRATPLITNPADAHYWPWHAAIYHVVDDSDREYKCGGTLINSKAILTAAHCVQVPVNEISVSLGRLNLGVNENSGQAFGVAEVIVHPDYDKEFLHNDIAIIKLSTDATFNRYVRPVCLWNSSNTDLLEIVGELGTIVGWGRTQTGEESNVLQEATAPVVNLFECLGSHPELFEQFLSENNFCAGYRNGTGICAGDTGGSITLIRNGIYYIRGIVSIGPGKLDREAQEIICDVMQFAIFTDVAKYLQWIKDNQ